MSQKTAPRKAATAPLVHWLLLVCGLALVTFESPQPFGSPVLPLWLGTVAGTAFGQMLAWRRIRPWLVAFMLGNATWFGALLLAPLWWWLLPHESDTWDAVGITLTTFIPGALCGYLSLSERGGLVAFWFPAMLWTLGILDLPGGTNLQGVQSWLLLSGLALLLVGFLRARETRRVGLWQTTVPGRVADGGAPTVLHEAPLRSAAQLGFSMALGALTLIATAWIAPHLWQKEKVPGKTAGSATHSTTGGASGAGGGVSCCPEGPAEPKRERVREYLPMLHSQGEDVAAPKEVCLPCHDGVASTPVVSGGAGTHSVTSTVLGTDPGPASYPGGGVVSGHPTSTPTQQAIASSPPTWPMASASPRPPTRVPPPAKVPPHVAAAPTTPPPAPPPAAPPVARIASVAPPPPRPVAAPVPVAVVVVAAKDDPLFAWLFTAAIVGLGLHLSLRPLRRWLTLRHLRRPLWTETVDQRVSNLWQLVLVGLRDAGWHTIPGEQPTALARRIGLDGLAACAVVLERARHGVRVDEGDLQTMETAARSVYDAARRRAGWAGRAASSLRWPLV